MSDAVFLACRQSWAPSRLDAQQWAEQARQAIRVAAGIEPPLWTVLAVARAVGAPNRVDRQLQRIMRRAIEPGAAASELHGPLVGLKWDKPYSRAATLMHSTLGLADARRAKPRLTHAKP